MVAVGNAFRALGTRESGAGAPPKRRPSRGCPTKELSLRSEIIAGTLILDIGVSQHKIRQNAPSSHRDIFSLYQPNSSQFGSSTMQQSKYPLCSYAKYQKISNPLKGEKVPPSTSHFRIKTIFIPVMVAIILQKVSQC